MPQRRLLLPSFFSYKRNLWPIQTQGSILKISVPRMRSTDTKFQLLEKPEKFNPPCHGASLRRPSPRYYGPQLTEGELAQQRVKKYPNMMPLEGTFMHWFLHNKLIHLWISLSILTSLTIIVVVSNFRRDSPFADMLPEWYNMFLHPVQFWQTVLEIIKLDTARISAETSDKRKQRVDDVAKRAAYRKAQGLNSFRGIDSWTNKSDANILGPESRAGSERAISSENDQTYLKVERPEKRPLKKWLGIW